MATYILFSSKIKIANTSSDDLIDKIGAFFTSDLVIAALGLSIIIGIPMFS